MLFFWFKCLTLLLLLTVIALLVSMWITRLLIRLLPDWGMLDIPKDNRRVHTRPVPRGGGIAIVLTFVLVVIATTFLNPLQEAIVDTKILKILLPLCILFPLGVLDDKYELKAKTKFSFQILAAALAWYLGYRMKSFFGLSLNTPISFVCTIIWITAMINAFNMIDGVDGLASGIGIISASCMIIIALGSGQQKAALILAIFAGSTLGFLRFNWHPASIFMGDCGSMFIGYILSVIGIYISAQIASAISIFVPLLACGIPFIDITLAVWRRLTSFTPEEKAKNSIDYFDKPTSEIQAEQGLDINTQSNVATRSIKLLEKLGKADKSHLHHRLLFYFNNNQKKTVLSIYRLAIFMGIAGIACCFLPKAGTMLAYVIFLGTLALVINRLAVIELWNSTELLYSGFQRARVGLLLGNAINPVIDICIICLAYFNVDDNVHFSIGLLARHIAPIMIVLMLSRNYHVFWNYPSTEEYFRLILTLTLAFICAWLPDFIDKPNFEPKYHLYAWALSVTCILAERLCLNSLRLILIRRHNNSPLSAFRPVITVIYGIDPQARMYYNCVTSNLARAERENVIGFITRDIKFRHGYCYGLKVLGGIDDLEQLFTEYHIDKIILALEPSGEELDVLKTFCKIHKVKLCTFLSYEEEISL